MLPMRSWPAGLAPCERGPGQGSAVDAVVVAMAEPGGAILPRDIEDLQALAAHARNVSAFTA